MDLEEAIQKVYEWLEPHFEDVEGLQEAWELIRDSLPPYGESMSAKDLARMHIEKALKLLDSLK